MNRLFCFVGLALAGTSAFAGDYQFRVVAEDLASPVGIEAAGNGNRSVLYFTQVPTPGVPGSMGGLNKVSVLHLRSGMVEDVDSGDPEPLHIALGEGALYWTCRAAGVIVRKQFGGTATPILTGLARPTGIDVDAHGNVFFTLVPEPGVPMGANSVEKYTGTSIVNVSTGEPEPTDVVVGRDGTAYWTCKSAGVILKAAPGAMPSLVLSGLNQPNGIALDKSSNTLYFTELPTPGVPGSMGGQNRVWEYDLRTGRKTLVHFGDPEPTDVTVATNGTVYWTCTSAGVIVEASRRHRPAR